jgi:hypothetical protein
MLIVFLSVNGAILINWLPPREKVDSGYFCERILKLLSEILHNRRPVHSARAILHFDNATLHRPAVLAIVLKVANPDRLPNLRTALISAHANSLYSII